MFCTFSLQSILLATAACNFLTSELQKVLRTPRVLYMFTSKCAFRHSGVQFFDIRTSKNAPNVMCFVHFDFKMRFSPQWRAIFRHPNLRNCSNHEVFCTFSLQNVLFATTACNLWFLRWAPTSAYFSTDPTHESLKKTQHFATSLTFGADVSSFFWLSRYCIFFLLTWLLYSAFSTVHIVGSLLFKLPSVIYIYIWFYFIYTHLHRIPIGFIFYRYITVLPYLDGWICLGSMYRYTLWKLT